MKITLTKNMTLHVATVYMKIRKNILREDIQEYLKGKQFENKLINNRINEYLKEIRIYDDELHLTQRGEIVRDRGLLSTYEEGKYRIWFTQGDDFWGNRIMYFRREAPNEKSSLESLDLNFGAGNHLLLPSIEKAEEINSTTFSLDDNNLVGNLSQITENSSVTIIFENEKATTCFFSGKLKLGKDNSIELNYKKPIIVQNESLEKVIFEILPDYDNDYKRLKVSFNPEYKNFKVLNYPCTWKGFSGYIDSVNLMPFDSEDAIKWRNNILRDVVSKNYLSPNDFVSEAVEINNIQAFEKYKNDLDIPKSRDFNTTSDIEKWHINAPIDLNPNGQLTYINEIIALQKGEKISFEEIVRKLGIDENVENELVIYYDQYVGKVFQQKAAAAFMESIKGSKKIILTDLSPEKQKSDYIMQYKKNIQLRDINHGVFKGKPLHDRYLIISSTSGIKYWAISNSLDFIRFTQEELYPGTQGRLIQPIVFTPIKTIDKELLNFVNNEKHGK